MSDRNEPNQLQTFSDVLSQIGEESRRKQDERLEELREGATRFRHDLCEMSDEDQLDWFASLVRLSRGSDPRENEIWQAHLEFLKAHLLLRLFATPRPTAPRSE